jgi:hypothetical protein
MSLGVGHLHWNNRFPSDKPGEEITFLVVGCQRCGTTWVDAALREHPQVYLPAKKQSYFFNGHYEKGFEWYLNNFQSIEPRHLAVGEVATGYCLLHAIPRMAAHLPHIKLVMTVRNPVERAISAYLSSQSEKVWKSFEDYVASQPDVLERGHYAEQIEALLLHYDRSQILLLFFDDLVANDRVYLRNILNFIEVDGNFESSQVGTVRNATTLPRLRYALYRAGLRPFVHRLSKSRFGNIIRRTRKRWKAPRISKLDRATHAKLVNYYRPWNARLSALAGRDLSSWES